MQARLAEALERASRAEKEAARVRELEKEARMLHAGACGSGRQLPRGIGAMARACMVCCPRSTACTGSIVLAALDTIKKNISQRHGKAVKALIMYDEEADGTTPDAVHNAQGT
jgi:hypothetical protein